MKRLIFDRRWLFIALIASAQLTALLFGTVWFARIASNRTRSMIREQIFSDNELIAGQFAQFIDTMNLTSIRHGTADWRQLQTLVEEIELPNQGFICVTDLKEGQLVCHPELRLKPELSEKKPGLATMRVGPKRIPMRKLGKRQSNHNAGWAQMADGVHLISVRRLAGLDANLSVHQKEEAISASVRSLHNRIRSVGFTVAVLVVVFSTLASFMILRWFDTRLMRLNDNLEKQVQVRTRSLLTTRNATIFGLAKLAESRDTDTGEHLDRIRQYVTLLAREMTSTYPQIDEEYVANVALASSLHDIGKVGIPDAILLKPGKLTEGERRTIERHATIGGECLAAIEQRLGDDDFLEMARKIAYSHHERWDGSGYPHGLEMDSIPLAARIVAVADVYDALTTKRPYKDAFTHEEARQIILDGVATQFDPDIVEAFLATEDEFASISAINQSAASDRSHENEGQATPSNADKQTVVC